MCASYGAPESTLVSTRSTVPDTFASAAARTLDSTSPVSSFSVLPLAVWPPFDGSNPPRGALADGVGVVDALPEVAAFANAAPPSAAAATAVNVTSLDRMLPIRTPLLIAGARRASRPALRVQEESPGSQLRAWARKRAKPGVDSTRWSLVMHIAS